MIIGLTVYCTVLTVFYAVSSYFSYVERQKLIDLLAAKDYADYKNFENKEDKTTDHNNMFVNREKKHSQDEEV